ncbi:hypothetical protein ACNKHN_02785 [Shigella flexneri]
MARTQSIGLLAITGALWYATAGLLDCLYRPDDAAHGALAGRRRSLVAARHATCYPCPAAVCPYHRRVIVPGELRVSVVSAFIGAPGLIFLGAT